MFLSNFYFIYIYNSILFTYQKLNSKKNSNFMYYFLLIYFYIYYYLK